ncbi:unnamed protein product [Clavelina lepadiformis]|uniref:Alpha-amylase n=1 Tax=Clavelina lepadiformis TaxID=159417 RepID=A0ABP0GGD5_CLALP
MVARCNKARVRVYVDAVINHMCAADAGQGSKSQIVWPARFESKISEHARFEK